ncbi:MAG: hypothetical protein GC168_00205 [Candidatus Hydrogenedens sp.]|nr:hypothetical protein [Candidatus Hydrogenedens sp.]
MQDKTQKICPNWNYTFRRCLIVGSVVFLFGNILVSTQADALGGLGDILDPIIGSEGEGESGLIDEITDPLLGGDEGEGESGLIDEITDPLLGSEGEGENGLIDDITDPLLGGEGEGEGGLLDDILDPILGGSPIDEILDPILSQLPLPILGPDEFEPDNGPGLAVFSGLLDLSVLNSLDILSRLQTHNFHVDGDVDWKRFYASSGQAVTVETRDLLSAADTFISVYRLLDEDEVVAVRPTDCLEDAIEGPDGKVLVPVACNDDAPDVFNARRSMVQFIAPRTGFYFVRIEFSPKARENKSGETSGPETTYNYVASGSGVTASTLYCTVLESGSGNAIMNGLVELNPYNIQQSHNQSGVYPIDGIPSGNYTVRVTAPGKQPRIQQVYIATGQQKDVVFQLEPDTQGNPEGETNGPEGEGTVEGSTEGQPQGNEGEGAVEGSTEGQTGGNEGETGGCEGEPAQSFYSGDYTAPYGELDLGELMRGIQLFNARAYHCDDTTEDGYAPYPGSRVGCLPHASDYLQQDWVISLSEVLRLVQLFNIGGFSACEAGEDGVCPNQK